MITLKDFQADYLEFAACNRLWEFLKDSHSEADLSAQRLRIQEREEKILQSFGLPSTPRNFALLQITSLNPDFCLAQIAALYADLREEAGRYLSSSAVTDLQLLETAQKWELSIDDVLPQTSLKLKTEAYYHYLYAKYFLPGHLSPQSFLEEIRIVEKNKLATRIYNLTLDLQGKEHSDYVPISGYGLVYLDEFLTGYGDFINENERKTDLIN